ncbi:MAG: hypothetical protein B6244_01465 [Candidatus Cloacimonetes bacterium 4572_55]|nr:MAG: hypothetical protein B6244_01465 [Candidatus Cloacimonetes bacterium 4572_55]
MAYKVLIIDDTREIHKYCMDFMDYEYDFECFDNGFEGLKRVKKGDVQLILLDKNFSTLPSEKIMGPDPKTEGVYILKKLKNSAKLKKIPVIMVTNFADYNSTVEALDIGADDYVEWEALRIDDFFLERKMLDLLENRDREHAELIKMFNKFGLIGKSDKMLEMFKPLQLAVQDASWDKTVLILGETGVGKELVARAVHHLGSRSRKGFVSINCAAIPGELLESELFGHEKGAFTDARRDKVGLFEIADHGTAFLDEIGSMSHSLQPKLLRFLQSRSFMRVGATTERNVDVRIVAATNVDLRELVKQGDFREDLYYRFNVLPIVVPALNERSDDIPSLAKFFLKQQRGSEQDSLGITNEAIGFLKKRRWFGNVRELENFIRRVSLGKHKVVTLKDVLMAERLEAPIGGDVADGRCATLEQNECPFIGKIPIKKMEKMMIIKVLEKNDWYVKKACEDLQIGKSKFYQRINEYELKDKVKGFDGN